MELGTELLQIFGQVTENIIKEFATIRLMLHYVLSNRYQTTFKERHTEFGIPPQGFAYEMISEKCKSTPTLFYRKINFALLIFQRWTVQEKTDLFKNQVCHSTSFFSSYLLSICQVQTATC